jgi:hypothetical protein
MSPIAMGMRAAQIHKAGALELRPAIKDPKTEADEEGRDRIGGRFFHVRSNSKTGIDRLYDSLWAKTFRRARATAPGGELLIEKSPNQAVTTSRLGLIFRAHGDRPRELPARWRTILWKTE